MSTDHIDMASQTVFMKASPEALYDMIADVTRMGAWSPACVGATWDDGAGPKAVEDQWFTGHNVVGERAYDAHCQITAASRPDTIAWMQGGKDQGLTEWRYTFAPVEGGTEVTESWTLLRPFPADRVEPERVPAIRAGFEANIQETLTRLKADVERT